MALLDEASLREFLATTYPRLVAGIALITGSRGAAEDAVQEALARAWERSERGEQIESLPAWVTRVAMNLSRSRLRRMRVEAKHREEIVSSTRDAFATSDHRMDVERALAALPRRQREATVLRYYLGMDLAEIAGALHVNQGTVKTTLFRARKTLATALGEPEAEAQTDEEDGHARLR